MLGITNLDKLQQIEGFVEDPQFRDRWQAIKQENKRNLADYIWKHNSLEIDPNSIFDVQVKRMHEYKRQPFKCAACHCALQPD